MRGRCARLPKWCRRLVRYAWSRVRDVAARQSSRRCCCVAIPDPSVGRVHPLPTAAMRALPSDWSAGAGRRGGQPVPPAGGCRCAAPGRPAGQRPVVPGRGDPAWTSCARFADAFEITRRRRTAARTIRACVPSRSSNRPLCMPGRWPGTSRASTRNSTACYTASPISAAPGADWTTHHRVTGFPTPTTRNSRLPRRLEASPPTASASCLALATGHLNSPGRRSLHSGLGTPSGFWTLRDTSVCPCHTARPQTVPARRNRSVFGANTLARRGLGSTGDVPSVRRGTALVSPSHPPENSSHGYSSHVIYLS